MIPFIRSITELMMVTQSRNQTNTIKEIESNVLTEDSAQRKRYLRSKEEKVINLPNIPNITRRKWIKSKEVVSKILEELDYNNQIQSSYDLTLLDRLRTYDSKDAA